MAPTKFRKDERKKIWHKLNFLQEDPKQLLVIANEWLPTDEDLSDRIFENVFDAVNNIAKKKQKITKVVKKLNYILNYLPTQITWA